MDIQRVIIIVVDSLGVGALPDAARYGDEGSHTLDNTSRVVGGIRLKNLAEMGLGLIEGVESVERAPGPLASYGRMREASAGKDTTTGHHELMGLITKEPLITFPEGFPLELMERFALETGFGWLFGKPASGTEIIERLGEEHIRTGRLIVYTSADSVFQVAAHEEVVPLETLYDICERARALLDGYRVGRVIARPFKYAPEGSKARFVRTGARRDFSMDPEGETLLDALKARSIPVKGIGKIGDIFAHRGLTEELPTKGNLEGMDVALKATRDGGRGLVFMNLIDFDMLYGHRNDPEGYARALEKFDSFLPDLVAALSTEDLLIITADHGCDPTTPSTDHSREYVPLLVYSPAASPGRPLDTRSSFADVAATVAEIFGFTFGPGRSFIGEISV